MKLDIKRAIDMARARKKWSLLTLSLEMDTNQMKLTRLRNGSQRLLFTDALLICNLCGCTIQEFLGWAKGQD
jgi:hypothetical protein